jgi:hypothetical protein
VFVEGVEGNVEVGESCVDESGEMPPQRNTIRGDTQ